MGVHRGPYSEDFPVGTMVRVADRDALEAFRRDWQWHHPLEAIQVPFAGQMTLIRSVSFYHGGDELYELVGIPGIWHGQCLRTVSG